MKIKPVGKRILIKRLQPEEKKINGLIIPDKFKKSENIFEVIEVGKDTCVNIGDRVMMIMRFHQAIDINGEEHVIANDEDVVAIVGELNLRV